jgi:hypothetical protein
MVGKLRANYVTTGRSCRQIKWTQVLESTRSGRARKSLFEFTPSDKTLSVCRLSRPFDLSFPPFSPFLAIFGSLLLDFAAFVTLDTPGSRRIAKLHSSDRGIREVSKPHRPGGDTLT